MIFPLESFARVQSSAVTYPAWPCHDLLLDGAGTLDWAETRAAARLQSPHSGMDTVDTVDTVNTVDMTLDI